MITAILALLPSLLALVVKIMERRWKRADDPQTRHEQNLDSINEALAADDSDRVNVQLQSQLDRLQNARRGDPRGQSGD